MQGQLWLAAMAAGTSSIVLVVPSCAEEAEGDVITRVGALELRASILEGKSYASTDSPVADFFRAEGQPFRLRFQDRTALGIYSGLLISERHFEGGHLQITTSGTYILDGEAIQSLETNRSIEAAEAFNTLAARVEFGQVSVLGATYFDWDRGEVTEYGYSLTGGWSAGRLRIDTALNGSFPDEPAPLRIEIPQLSPLIYTNPFLSGLDGTITSRTDWDVEAHFDRLTFGISYGIQVYENNIISSGRVLSLDKNPREISLSGRMLAVDSQSDLFQGLDGLYLDGSIFDRKAEIQTRTEDSWTAKIEFAFGSFVATVFYLNNTDLWGSSDSLTLPASRFLRGSSFEEGWRGSRSLYPARHMLKQSRNVHLLLGVVKPPQGQEAFLLTLLARF